MKSAKPVEPSAFVQLPHGLTACTGVVTVAARDTQKSTQRQTIYGENGRIVATHNVDTFTHTIRFRIIAQDSDARPVQVPISLSIDEDLVFLQDGDLVTVIGARAKSGLFWGPAIANHAGRFVMIPRASRGWSIFLKIIIASTLFFIVVPWPMVPKNLDMFDKIAWLIGGAAAFKLGLSTWQRGVLERTVRRTMAGFTESWESKRYVDPCGTVEGVFAFTRGTQNPVEWVSFRLALPGPDGKTQDWIVAAAKASALVTDLRKGDVVRLRGEYVTGTIQRPTSIDLVSTGEGGD
ncbi:MAG: hypothetical protein EOP21_00060 [Hyphomicrobiales bacterium]|nr:MAG: hypothetical protein EOP21_00060 [Hyphomicrobiales bacterium]